VPYGARVTRTVKALLATWRPAGGQARVVMVRQRDGGRAYFCTRLGATAAEILEVVADRGALGQAFKDVKEAWGAGPRQARILDARVGCFNLDRTSDRSGVDCPVTTCGCAGRCQSGALWLWGPRAIEFSASLPPRKAAESRGDSVPVHDHGFDLATAARGRARPADDAAGCSFGTSRLTLIALSTFPSAWCTVNSTALR
jgi:hypothetical protein